MKPNRLISRFDNEGEGHSLKLGQSIDFGQVSNAGNFVFNQGAIPESGDKSPLAIYKSVSAKLAKRSKRGGARNSKNRVSWGLTSAKVRDLMEARHFASRISLPFTRWITIHWQRAGVTAEGMVTATGAYLRRLSRMMQRAGYEFAYLWVHENSGDNGHHCHILAHVPKTMAAKLTKKQKGWLREITGRPYKRRVIRSDPIGGWLGLENSNLPLLEGNVAELLGYVLKGAFPEAALAHGLPRRVAGGRVTGKRSGVSQNIAAKARKVHV